MSEGYTAADVELDCLTSGARFRQGVPTGNVVREEAYLAIECDELACMIAFINTMYETALQTDLRLFPADCHARVTDHLLVLWERAGPPGEIAWLTAMLRIMRDERVFRTVRAVAAGLVAWRFSNPIILQEAADVLAALYADEPEPQLWVRCYGGYMLGHGIVDAGGVDITREWCLRNDVVRPCDMWNRLVHKHAPAGPTRDHYRRLADRLFGSLLLAFERLQTAGVIEVAQDMMLEEMLQEVSMQVVRDSA